MTNEGPGGPEPSARAQADRRAPVARYVEFADESVQARFIAVADTAFHRLLAADRYESVGSIELKGTEQPGRSGLFRRRSLPGPVQVVPTTAALARVARAAAETPDLVHALPNSCTSARRVSQVLADVAGELVDDLLTLDPADQAAHPAYRQTLRLAAELEAVSETVAGVGCTDPRSCVGIRSPEHWGRRIEDVEVSEVRAVLLRLALDGTDTHPDA